MFEAVIPGRAVPKGSRVSGVTRTGVRYNREANPAVGPFMKLARGALHARALEVGHEPWEKSHALSVMLVFRVERPKSPSYSYPPRGDIDKLARAVLDACTGIVWDDDSQVVRLDASKVFAGESRTLVSVCVL